MNMRTDTTHYQAGISNVLLPGTILLANIDMAGLFEYALKAAVGGGIWLAYKITAEYLERRKNTPNARIRNRIRKAQKKSSDDGITQ